MGGGGQFVKNLTAEYLPAYGLQTLHALVTTAAGVAERLASLFPTPAIPDDRFTVTQGHEFQTRCPWHLIIQVPSGALNPIYITWDNNTAPVVGGPGLEVNPGGYVKFEHAEALLTPHTQDAYQVDALSAIQIIAAAATPVLLHYSD